MDISLSSINNILTNNKLIRGRLRLTASEINKLYRLQVHQNRKIQKELANKQKTVKASLDQIKNLKSELKCDSDTLQKAFYPTTNNISLLYKNIANHYYIKARFYWQGKQREVQVGSIPIVLDIIHQMLDQGYLQDISVPKSGQMTWDQFKNRAKLIEATKEIAALKFQEYIIRKLLSKDKDQFGIGDLDAKHNEKLVIEGQAHKSEGEYNQGEKIGWYVQWRRNNL